MTHSSGSLVGVLRWEDPPPPTFRGTGKAARPWPLVAKDLRDHPGRWGVVLEDGGTNSGTAVARISNGLTQWFQPAGAFFALQRQRNHVIEVYAVYIGEHQEYAEEAGVSVHRVA